MEVRTLVTFRSSRFNTSETKAHYITPCCFGDDVTDWMLQRLKERGVSVDENVGQEPQLSSIRSSTRRPTYPTYVGIARKISTRSEKIWELQDLWANS